MIDDDFRRVEAEAEENILIITKEANLKRKHGLSCSDKLWLDILNRNGIERID